MVPLLLLLGAGYEVDLAKEHHLVLIQESYTAALVVEVVKDPVPMRQWVSVWVPGFAETTVIVMEVGHRVFRRSRKKRMWLS